MNVSDTLQTELLPSDRAARAAGVLTAPNGLHFALIGALEDAPIAPGELPRLVAAVPPALADALRRHVYAFVPLVLTGESNGPLSSDTTQVSLRHDAQAAERAVCHRNAAVDGREFVFLSSRLHDDRFALAFELFINVAHNFLDAAGTPESFTELVRAQAERQVRGETSMDAWEHRSAAFGRPAEPESRRAAAPPHRLDERARTAYGDAAFSDALAIYMLSLFLDFDYADLREREYPLLAPPALAERLRAVAALFPAPAGFQFQIHYRRKSRA